MSRAASTSQQQEHNRIHEHAKQADAHRTHAFMQNQCGLVNTANPCRCAKKTRGFAKARYLDPEKLLFARERIIRVHEMAERKSADLTALDEAYAKVYRDHPFHDSPDFVASLRTLIARADFKSFQEVE